MDLDAAFDKVLHTRDKETIFHWAMDRLAWNPDSIQVRAIAAFAFLAVGQRWTTREMAREILAEDPDQLWALAAAFVVSHWEDVENSLRYFEEGAFRLGPEWIVRLKCIRCEEEAHRILYFQARFGIHKWRADLSENYMLTDRVPDIPKDGPGYGKDPFCPSRTA